MKCDVNALRTFLRIYSVLSIVLFCGLLSGFLLRCPELRQDGVALTRPQERIHLAGDYLGTFYTDTAVETASRAAGRVLEQLRRRDG